MTDQLQRTSVLDNPVWWSARGAHADLVRRTDTAAVYPDDVALFGGVADPAGWAELAELTGPDRRLLVVGVDAVPETWHVDQSLPGVQLVAGGPIGAPDPEVLRLGPADVPDMLDLVRRTEPGPFLPRTIELGRYVGIRRDGVLAAMAGERLQPTGYTEISAVCTDPAFRGQGLATRLIRAVGVGIDARGETAFLHTAANNTGAIRLYEALGFLLRRPISFRLVRPAS